MSYLPSVWARLWELWAAIVHVPPRLVFAPGDVLVVCDAIEAYRPLFRSPLPVQVLIKAAHAAKVPVVLTRWVRTDVSTFDDAVDAKAHWSFYVPPGQTDLLVDSQDATVVDVRFTDAFAHPAFRDAMPTDAKRVVLAGAWGESCVLNTARAALSHTLQPVVVQDATVGHGLANWWACVQVQLFYGQVVRGV